MIGWMIYVMAVTVVLSAAALLAEHAAHQRRASRRWIWALTIVSSLLIPTIISTVTVELPTIFTPAVSQKLFVLRDSASLHLPFDVAASPVTQQGATSINTDLLLQRAWMAASAALAIALLVSGALLLRRKKQWHGDRMAGAEVFIAPDVGPAVVGLLRPRIVVPAWLTDAPKPQQALVIAHEQSHLDALDPQLLSVALCLLVSMPWNFPLWWQLHRLRRAIEVDCDARVLRSKVNLRDYGTTLIEVGQRQSGFLGIAAPMSESASFLEQRISIMATRPAAWGHSAAAALACLSVIAAVIAARIVPPNAAPAHGKAEALVPSPSALAGYEGTFQIAGNLLLRLSARDGRLLAKSSGQAQVELQARSETEFFADRLSLSVVRDATGRASAVVLRKHGEPDVTAPRIDEAVARQIDNHVAAKVREQSATPGTEAAVRRLDRQMRQTPPDLSGLGPMLAQAIIEQQAPMQAHLARLGAMRSVEFTGVTTGGADKYLVRYEHGSAQWLLSLDTQGVIVTAFVGP